MCKPKKPKVLKIDASVVRQAQLVQKMAQAVIAEKNVEERFRSANATLLTGSMVLVRLISAVGSLCWWRDRQALRNPTSVIFKPLKMGAY